MSNPTPEIEAVQPDIVAFLNSDSYFIDIPVIALRKERIQSEFDATLSGINPKGGHAGVGVEVLMPALDSASPNSPGPFCTIKVLLRVKENPLVNLGLMGTQKTAEAVATRILQLLHGLGLPGILTSTLYAAPQAISPSTEFLPLVAYYVEVHAAFKFTPLAKLSAPQIVCPVLSVVISHPDSAATLYYTTDSSFPGPGNAAAQVYAAPFAVSAGTYIRAAAYKSGYAGSDAAMSEITA